MNKLRILFITTGTVLIIAALFLCLYNTEENKRAAENAENTLSVLIEAIPEPTQKPTDTTIITTAAPDLYAEYETTTTTVPPLPTIELNGRLYCGYVTIAALHLELPVANELDYNVLKSSPCRYRGTADGGDLIIAAHNYNSHFGKLKDLSEGDEIMFTDCEGNQHLYSVISIESVGGTDIDSMLAGSTENWQLTLFTCDLSGRSRVTIRAKHIEK